MSTLSERDRLVELRRDLHRRPEPAWCEFYTTARIVEEIERIGVDDLYVGPDAIDADSRSAVPDDAELERWHAQAEAALAEREGSDPSILDQLRGGTTGAVAVLERGEGPTIGLRVDIDALPREEADGADHHPAAEGFRSIHDAMHACGHDAHATIGLGVLERIADSDFSGTFKLFFQPAEEVIGGGKAMANSGHLDDVDYLLAMHIGLDHPTGEIVAGIDDFLAVSHLTAEFRGESAHAGANPERGRNANQALAAAVQNLYAIPRHADGGTRVNAGRIEGGSASNIIAERATIEGEVRGETSELRDYVIAEAERVIENAAGMYDCESELHVGPSAPSAESDQALVDAVAAVAPGVAGVEQVVERAPLGGSEDATYLMREVQENGGLAAYVGVGTDHPGGHHTATFDVDEESLQIGVDVLADAVERIAET
ncbi:aminobenzoyl-glutamate utilization protein A [Natronoarchaeum philippinense]|uniref:Aminobenzoyl-glutamate utilization protein A n=1 Tax=Natronoarchaeum philippinense TaxID=558529 RepID=A0A285NSY0_NATPI|nr:amidohydrolase [Natronoarchaeum philippinense]SNZ12565.1 aminobenzoyl-glutamate utilization protein A [Natronoarchaeum philippinense]